MDSTVKLYIDEQTDSLIYWAVTDLADDIEIITGKRPKIEKVKSIQNEGGIYIGEIDDNLFKNVSESYKGSLTGAWEAYMINYDQENLYVLGSDIRGTVYAIFDIAERLGISPWQWWADVKPMRQDKLLLQIPEEGIFASPSVQYRGIFLNDEGWGLNLWAAKTFEPEIGDIGPKTYEKIFQLLLRLKANTIWPAMHPCTEAFDRIPGNKEMAQKYHIIIGTSHAEPMLRNNVTEWNHDSLGEYNYFTNKESVNQYWQSRIEEVKDRDNQFIVTTGMRGIHDGHMEGMATIKEKVAIMGEIINSQRTILSSTLERSPESIPQTFIPYKEVLELYDSGLEVPEDVTIMWTDDNYGYIRRLSNESEQQRKGGSGVYYHLSYWGRPHDYLWLSTTQPGLIWFEMSRAYQNGAKKIWIANVGDIKPSEYNIEFFLDLAWDINMVDENNINSHMIHWLEREFGKEVSIDIAEVMNEYYRLAFLRKPEFMGWNQVEPHTPVRLSEFNINANGNELKKRIDMYQALVVKIETIKNRIPEERYDAWFQLIEYPVKGAAFMNFKFLYAQFATQMSDSTESEKYKNLSTEYYHQIAQLTSFYNEEMSSGKWKYMMSMRPRNLTVFDLPETKMDKTLLKTDRSKLNNQNPPSVFIQARDFSEAKANGEYKWREIKGLGYSNAAITLMPLTTETFTDILPYVKYDFVTDHTGDYEVEVRCLPTHSNNFDHQVSIRVDGKGLETYFINTKGRSSQWKENVLRNSQVIKYVGKLEEKGKHSIEISINQTGIVVDQIAVNFDISQKYYELPNQ